MNVLLDHTVRWTWIWRFDSSFAEGMHSVDSSSPWNVFRNRRVRPARTVCWQNEARRSDERTTSTDECFEEVEHSERRISFQRLPFQESSRVSAWKHICKQSLGLIQEDEWSCLKDWSQTYRSNASYWSAWQSKCCLDVDLHDTKQRHDRGMKMEDLLESKQQIEGVHKWDCRSSLTRVDCLGLWHMDQDQTTTH